MSTKFQLLNAFLNGAFCSLHLQDGTTVHFKVIDCIEREDGSNHCYNVTGIDQFTGDVVTHFIRTLD